MMHLMVAGAAGLSSYSIGAGADGIPSESLALNFSKIEMHFTGMGPDVSGSPVVVGYDLTQTKTD
jgi:hypothetical protein